MNVFVCPCIMCICMYTCVWVQVCRSACVWRLILDCFFTIFIETGSLHQTQSLQLIFQTHLCFLSLKLQGIHHIHPECMWVLGIQFCSLLFSGMQLDHRAISPHPPREFLTLSLSFLCFQKLLRQ